MLSMSCYYDNIREPVHLEGKIFDRSYNVETKQDEEFRTVVGISIIPELTLEH